MNTGGPAFPTTVYTNESFQGMTLRQYAAIHLKVPNSGTDWLDEMIEQANKIDPKGKQKGTLFVADLEMRDYFAAKAMHSIVTHQNCPKVFDENIVAVFSYQMADAMLKAREQ